MISSRSGGDRAGDDLLAAELEAAGWQRCFVADEPRLSEAVETYGELGYEVTLLPFTPAGSDCSECVSHEPGRCAVIYVRKRSRD